MPDPSELDSLLPKFEDKKTYVPTGETLNKFRAAILAVNPRGDGTTICASPLGAGNGVWLSAIGTGGGGSFAAAPWQPTVTGSAFTLTPGRVRDFGLTDMTVSGLGSLIDCPAIGDAVWLEIDIAPTTYALTASIQSGTMPDTFVFSGTDQTAFNLMLIEVAAATDTRPGIPITVSGEARLLIPQFSRGVDLVYDVFSGISVVSAKDSALNYPAA